MAAIAGQLVTEVIDDDRGRSVTVYAPPEAPKAIVFAADGGWHQPSGRRSSR